MLAIEEWKSWWNIGATWQLFKLQLCHLKFTLLIRRSSLRFIATTRSYARNSPLSLSLFLIQHANKRAKQAIHMKKGTTSFRFDIILTQIIPILDGIPKLLIHLSSSRNLPLSPETLKLNTEQSVHSFENFNYVRLNARTNANSMAFPTTSIEFRILYSMCAVADATSCMKLL